MNAMIYSSIALLLVLAGTYCQAEENDVGCELPDGSRLREGERTKGDPCSPCTCFHGQLSCVAMLCAKPMCVDPTNDPDVCCQTCPNGQNCRLPDGGVLQEGESITMSDGQVCRCPRRYYGDTLAICRPPIILS